MPKSCFDGYLTDECKNCPDWKDGHDGEFGCATDFPIMWCPHFKRMFEQEEAQRSKREQQE